MEYHYNWKKSDIFISISAVRFCGNLWWMIFKTSEIRNNDVIETGSVAM